MGDIYDPEFERQFFSKLISIKCFTIKIHLVYVVSFKIIGG